MKHWFDAREREALLARVHRLSADSTARWGRMNVQQVVCHMADLVRVALGEKISAPLGLPLGWPGLSWFVVWLMPWPRGVPTAPELRAGTGMTAPGDFARDKEILLELLDRFTAFPAERQFSPSPAFGPMSRAMWGRFMWRHVDHHLRQFGV